MIKGERAGLPRLAEFLSFTRARGGMQLPRSRRAREACERLAQAFDVDQTTIIEWANGREPIPDELIEPLADVFGCPVSFFMCWEGTPRSAISEHGRQVLADETAARIQRLLPGECESVLDHVEEGLHISEDASADVLDVPRLQKLRMAVLEYLAEPIEAVS